MSIENNIQNDVKICHLSDKVEDLQMLFNELTFTHLPIENDGVYLGCISEADIRCYDSEKTIAEYQYSLEGFFVRNDDYWLETLQKFAQNHTNILPVLSQENEYLGYLDLTEILSSFNETPFLSEPGGIIVLEKGVKDYSFSQIGQIAESHNAALLGIFVSSKDTDVTQITVKLSTSGLNEILQTFRRYGYTIVSEHQEDSFRESLKDRSKYLDKYLNI